VRILIFLSFAGMDLVTSKKQTAKPKPVYKKPPEDLMRDRALEKKHQQENSDNFNEYDNIDNGRMEDEKIVGVAKPLGYWTSLIIGENLTRYMAMRKGSRFTDRIKSKNRERQLQHSRERF
jgi:hypothetical protein